MSSLFCFGKGKGQRRRGWCALLATIAVISFEGRFFGSCQLSEFVFPFLQLVLDAFDFEIVFGDWCHHCFVLGKPKDNGDVGGVPSLPPLPPLPSPALKAGFLWHVNCQNLLSLFATGFRCL